jgi:hypothetical protein
MRIAILRRSGHTQARAVGEVVGLPVAVMVEIGSAVARLREDRVDAFAPGAVFTNADAEVADAVLCRRTARLGLAVVAGRRGQARVVSRVDSLAIAAIGRAGTVGRVLRGRVTRLLQVGLNARDRLVQRARRDEQAQEAEEIARHAASKHT